jgi:NAD(P)-dependent dehydrogenase (short-subunit alcohol dehydrogenase family)
VNMAQEQLDLPSRVLVTGAAGGIGAALVRRLLAAGAEVVATDQADQPPHDAGLAQPGCTWIRADLATSAGRQGLIDHLVHGSAQPLDGLVFVAGLLDPVDWDQITEEQVERLFALNVLAPYFLVRGLLPGLARQASVVLMGSIAALRASPKTPFYAASKAALRNLGASMALLLQPRGMRVNIAAPGLIDTPLTDALNLRLAHERGVTVAQVAAERAQAIPAGRAGSADEVVSACLFLLSRQASYCNGATLHPTGGVWAGTTW